MEELITKLIDSQTGQFITGMLVAVYILIKLYREFYKPKTDVVITPEFMAKFLENSLEITIDGKTTKRRIQEFQHDINNLSQKDVAIIDVLEEIHKDVLKKMDEHYPRQTKALNELNEEFVLLRKKVL